MEKLLFIAELNSNIDTGFLLHSGFKQSKYGETLNLSHKFFRDKLDKDSKLQEYYIKNYNMLNIGKKNKVISSVSIYNTTVKNKKVWYAKIELLPNVAVSRIRNEVTLNSNAKFQQLLCELKNYFDKELHIIIDYEKTTICSIHFNIDIGIPYSTIGNEEDLSNRFNFLIGHKAIFHNILSNITNEIGTIESVYALYGRKLAKYDDITINKIPVSIYDKGLDIYKDKKQLIENDLISFKIKFNSKDSIIKYLKINSIIEIDSKETYNKVQYFLLDNLIKKYIDQLIEKTKELQDKLCKNIIKGERYYFSKWLYQNIDDIVAKKQIRYILNTFTHLTDQQKRELMKTSKDVIKKVCKQYRTEQKMFENTYDDYLIVLNKILKAVNGQSNKKYEQGVKGTHFNLEIFLDKIDIKNCGGIDG